MFVSASSTTHGFAAIVGTLLFAGLCIGGATAPAAAQTALGVNAAGERTATIMHADLDLGSQAGRTRLESRIRSAARTICATGGRDVAAMVNEATCIANAVKSSRAATLAAAKAARTTG